VVKCASVRTCEFVMGVSSSCSVSSHVGFEVVFDEHGGAEGEEAVSLVAVVILSFESRQTESSLLSGGRGGGGEEPLAGLVGRLDSES